MGDNGVVEAQGSSRARDFSDCDCRGVLRAARRIVRRQDH